MQRANYLKVGDLAAGSWSGSDYGNGHRSGNGAGDGESAGGTSVSVFIALLIMDSPK